MTTVNRFAKLVIICGLTTAALSAGNVMAKGDGHQHQHAHQYKHGHAQAHFLLSQRGASKLDLSAEQQAKLKTIFATQKAQLHTLRDANKDVRKAQRAIYKAKMNSLLSSSSFDESAAKELLAQRHKKTEQVGLIKLKTQHQVWQVLNAEQREKLAELKNKHR